MTAPKRKLAGHVDQLHHALADLAARGQRTPCAERSGYLWLSDLPEDRALAAGLCRRGCPVLELCGLAAEANNEKFGTWAGRDRTRPKHAGQDEAA